MVFSLLLGMLVGINEKVVATAVETFEADLGANAFKHSVTDYAYSIAENIGLLHGMGSKHHCAARSALLQDVPKLPACFRIQSSCRLV